jgi:outer membrane protein assembly factor BamD (BamD/ComL family)
VTAPVLASGALARESNLAEERKLLDEARNALTRGDLEATMKGVERHQSRFPQGELAEEREALAIKALARLGRGDEARARAQKFKKKYAQSLLLDGIDADIRSVP